MRLWQHTARPALTLPMRLLRIPFMKRSVLQGRIAGKLRTVAWFLIFFLFMVFFGHGEKKDIPSGAGAEKIDPLHENALAFLDYDYGPLRLQADQLAREQKYYEAAQCYLAFLKFNHDDVTAIYNLACCYGKLGKADLAVQSLVMAARAGFRDFKLLASDNDFADIRNTPKFKKLLELLPVWEEDCGEVIFVKTSKVSELRVNLPAEFDPSRKYPLLIGLHGNGGIAEHMMNKMNQVLKNEPVILAAPQGAYPNYTQLRGKHFSWEIQTRNKELWKIADPLVSENLGEVIRVMQEKYSISEVYILGFSQGAAYAFLSGFRYAEMVAGIISIGGMFPESDTDFSMLTEKEIAAGKKFRVFVAQGNRDHLIPAGLGAQASKKLVKLGYPVEYLEYEGGHEISPDLMKEIYAWMMKQ